MVAHTTISYMEIAELTIPQIEAVGLRLGKHISLKNGIPFKETDIEVPTEEHTVEGALAFCGLFSGL